MPRPKLPVSQRVSEKRTTVRFRPAERAAANKLRKIYKLPTLSELLRVLVANDIRRHDEAA